MYVVQINVVMTIKLPTYYICVRKKTVVTMKEMQQSNLVELQVDFCDYAHTNTLLITQCGPCVRMCTFGMCECARF